MAKTIELTDELIEQLVNCPESGMGYQKVRVYFRNGETLENRKVLNCSLLVVNENEQLNADDIEKIELEY